MQKNQRVTDMTVDVLARQAGARMGGPGKRLRWRLQPFSRRGRPAASRTARRTTR